MSWVTLPPVCVCRTYFAEHVRNLLFLPPPPYFFFVYRRKMIRPWVSRVSDRLLCPVWRRARLTTVGTRIFGTTPHLAGGNTNVKAQPPPHMDDGSPELLEVELLSPEGIDVMDGEEEDIENLPEAGEQGAPKDGAAETITVLDTFARAKVANFIKRVQSAADAPGPQGALSSRQLTVEVREVQTSESDGDTLFHARLFVPLPGAYGGRWAEGLAPSSKEAELVAAMHAERIIDTLGIPMFQLTSKQQRHAEAARSSGRWAPMPGDDPLPPSTPSPPRLQLVREGAMREAERRLQIDKLEFSTVTAGTFTPMKLTLASPLLLDHGSVYRVKQFFVSYNCLLRRYCRITALHKHDNRVGSGSGDAAPPSCSGLATSDDEDNGKLFVAQIRLPIDGRFGERIACGKAPTKKEAYALACMHAELIIDALGLALYPSCRGKQEAHAAECRKVNRWCCGPDDCEYHYDRPSPPPLQLAKEADEVASGDVAASLESLLMSHAKAIENYTHVTELDALVLSARRKFMDYITQHGTCHGSAASPFFVEALGIKDHHVYRATVTVPVTPVRGSEEENKDQKVMAGDADELLPSFVAIGIGTSELEAETAASMHALHVLEVLNRPLGSEPENQSHEGKAPQNLTRSTKLPPPYRYVVSHVGRIMVPGLSPARCLTKGSGGTGKQANFMGTEESRLQRARAELPKSDWSLKPDADGYIIVNPNTNVEEGRNYVHTLPSVRQSDRFAIVRLRDYLERHGKRLESVLKTTVSSDADEGLKRWICKAVLPVPETFECVVAHGEAYREDEAMVMCAVHAELVLDEIGVAMYDLPALQKKHSGAAALLGRWAPLGPGQRRQIVCIPPPVRKEHEKSCLWARLSKEATTKMRESVPKEEMPAMESPPPSQRLPDVTSSTPSMGSTMAPSAPTSVDLKDDTLCDLSKLVSVHSSDILQTAPRLFDFYCRRMGVDVSRVTRQYNVSSPLHGFVHRAIAEIPLPTQFGRRHAVGCASTKKEAYTLCCMHAIFTLGALGVPVYSGSRQAEFAGNARRRGRPAPMPGDPLMPANTESPPGLKSLPDMHKEKPVVPTVPPRSECRKPFVWGSYLTACRAYIKRCKEHLIFDALFEQKRAPRSGVELEDTGLDIVEALPLFTNARSQLPQKCAASGLPSPPPYSFRFEVYGRVPNRRYLVEQPILGTHFVARGAGDEGYESVARAAMHYEYIVGVIKNSRLPDGVTDSKRVILRNQSKDIYDSSLRDFTPRGKLSVMALYTVLHAPFKPLRLMVKERATTGPSSQVTLITLLEMEDESGLRMTGKGEYCDNEEESRNRAIAELFKQLQLKSAFQATAQMFRSHPQLRVEGASHVADEGKLIGPLHALLSEHKIPFPSKPRTEQYAQLVQSLRRGEGFFDSQELQLLLSAVQCELGLLTSPKPLTLPSAARNLFISMGLTSPEDLERRSQGDAEGVNLITVALSLLAACVPPPLPQHGGEQVSVNGALPLQFAKLLLAGFLMDCQHLCLRVLALVLSSLTGRGSIVDGHRSSCRGGEVGGYDVLELMLPALSEDAQRFLNIIVPRLRRLVEHVEASVPAFDPLRVLLTSSPIPTAEALCQPLTDGLAPSREGRLRLAVTFASFPRAFVQKRAVAHNATSQVTVESKDLKRVLNVRVPPPLLVSCGVSQPRGGVVAKSGDGSAGAGATASSRVYSSLPCFAAFDKIPTSGDTHCMIQPVFGVFTTPFALLLASACCNDPRTLAVMDDVPGLAVVDGFVPVVTRGSESLSTLLELRAAAKSHWSGLRPLPAELQRAVDTLLSAEHNLAHIVQSGLLE
ncbi:hypothetical protein, conserved [Trypanosoma brucei brucei TREU927]|uniref:REH2 DRSM domain-containing protein n=1 Tax=Trypanosoma brucei brucei (strain 927/4 GUTat10.1) TaxID=185431 RepID=Q580M1_TRYB2|nr:hypothetical protein, conserved [Trypanosoma brucei brucei TREU927]AAX79326.1 hypothetical protein, conserved [Trypanosoma brucei]AAZ10454.1 hypothetical protein, conserved [Trypanosoma brucei brucei TREU927]